MRHTYNEVRPDVPPCNAWREISIYGDKQNGGNKFQINRTKARQLKLHTRLNKADKQTKQTKLIRRMQKLIQRGAYLHSLGSNFPNDLPLTGSSDPGYKTSQTSTILKS